MRRSAVIAFIGLCSVAAACQAEAQCPPALFAAAAAAGDAEQVDLCIADAADPDAGNADGVTPLMAAAARGHAEIVATLIDAGASVDVATDEGLTPLMFAAAWGRRDLVRTLVGAGADVSRTDAGGRTAIEWGQASLYMTGDVAVVVAQFLQNAETAPPRGERRPRVGDDAPDLAALIDRAETGAVEGAE